ncbi:SMI1/KNR4 family protein [Paenibacillus lautus]|uniref:SMI1/KNR4 family protein n=1 Tax=Paenibacillus lautus TaxID=1401 RepID=UPI003531025B
MERLQKFLLRQDRASLLGSPATQEEIANAEQRLNVRFHEDYVRFIRMFGGVYAASRYLHSPMPPVSEMKQSLI